MIRFLFGHPGCGKTHRMIEEIRSCHTTHQKTTWFLVPEQQMYSTERDILSTLPMDAGQYFTIVSFSRLCDILADQFGGRTQHAVTRAMRTLFMWQNLRELQGMLETYAATTHDDTFCREMLAVTEEFKRNAISSVRLESAADHLDKSSPLYGKLRDLALVSAAYDGLISDVYGDNPADRLLRAAEQIDAHAYFKGSYVYIDSFTSFTMQEYAVLRSIIEQAEDVTISFDCPARVTHEPQFDSMSDAIIRLTRMAKDAHKPYEDICLDTVQRNISPEILFLEKQLWSYETAEADSDCPVVPEEMRGNIRLTVAPTLYDEAEAAALHILELREAGIPYEKIAVVVRDTTVWKGVLDAAFDQYRIPYFLSVRTDLNEKPAARLLLTALRCVARHWQIEDVMSLAKTGLCGLSERDVDYFSEYTETWHLTGHRMTDDLWSMNPDGYTTDLTERGKAILLSANRVRETIMSPLQTLAEDLHEARTVTDQCSALYAYMTSVGVRERLVEAAEEHLRLGQVREAGETVRLWSFICETLAMISSVMETVEPLSADELGTVLSMVFADTDIGSVPARHDCVTVGDASTLRVDHIRAMLVLGLCEGEFPPSLKDNGLLSDVEKDVLYGVGIELDSRTERRMSNELLYIWQAFSKPSEKLFLSYSTSTPDGQTRTPSMAISRIRTLLPYLEPVMFSSNLLKDTDATVRHRTPNADTVSHVTARRLIGDEAWLSQSSLQTYARCPYSYYGAYLLKLREPVEAKLDNLGAGLFLHHVMEQYLRRALDEQNHIRPMTPDEIRSLADTIMEAYITSICGDAGHHGRLLHLFDRLRQVALVLIHSIQVELSRSDFRVAGLEWNTYGRTPSDPQPMVLTLESDRTGMIDESTWLTDPASFAQSVMDANYPANRAPTVETGKHGLPTRTPVQNMTPDGVMGLPILTPPEESPIHLLLGGRVDRVDMYRSSDGETVYIRVVDYKSSKHEFTVKSVTEDMNIQLLLYLFTLCSPENRALFADETGHVPKQVLPAAAVYLSPDETDREGEIRPLRTGISLSDPEIIAAVGDGGDEFYLPSVKRDKAGNMTGRGLLSSAQMADLETLLITTIRKTASIMYAGCANRTPSDAACRYCRMRSSCGIAQ